MRYIEKAKSKKKKRKRKKAKSQNEKARRCPVEPEVNPFDWKNMRWNVYEWRHGRTWNIPAISTYCTNVSEEIFLKPTKTFQKHFSVENHSRKWILFLLTLKISPTWTRIDCPVHFTSCGNKSLSKEYSSDGVSRKLYFLQNRKHHAALTSFTADLSSVPSFRHVKLCSTDEKGADS